MNLPPIPPGMSTIPDYPKINQRREWVFVKYPKQVTRKMIEQSFRDGAPNARYLREGHWVAVAAWHAGYLLIHNAIDFKSEELCQYACDAWNLQTWGPDEIKAIIDFSHHNK